jgi:hypothetical protein
MKTLGMFSGCCALNSFVKSGCLLGLVPALCFLSARDAEPTPSLRVTTCVLGGILVTPFAMSFHLVVVPSTVWSVRRIAGSPFPAHVLQVLQLGTKLKMVWIDAAGYVAAVHNDKPVRDRAHECLVSNAVGAPCSPVYVDLPIPIMGLKIAGPQPATVRTTKNVLMKAVDYVDLSASTPWAIHC